MEKINNLDSFKDVNAILDRVDISPNIEHQEGIKSDEYFTKIWARKMKHGMLRRESIYSEKGVLNHHFDIANSKKGSSTAVIDKIKGIAEEYKQGNKFNCIFHGRPGTGKTFLGTCLINEVNDNADKLTSCLFVSVPLLQNLWLARVRGNDFQQVEKMNHLEQSIKNADILILDDLGSETSMQTNNIKSANESTQKALFVTSDSRQGKSTIITTNYSSSDLQHMYNPKIISRLMTTNKDHIIDFGNLPDQRIIKN